MFIKESYIKQIGPKKFRVFSEKGKNMGTYPSMKAAKKRLSQIEYFKHKDSASDGHLFPRGGEGGVPQFFRKNLDYGKREEVLRKRLSKLKAAKSALQNLGFKKEAAEIKNNINSLLLAAFLILGIGAAGVHFANKSFESGKLKEMAEDFALEESPNLEEKKMVFPISTPVDDIVSTIYTDFPAENKKQIILEFLKEYNPNLSFDSGTLQLKEEEFIKHTHQAEVAYPELNNIMMKFIRKLSSGYDPSEVGIVRDLDISPEGMNLILSGEGFREFIYNDNEDFIWPRDKDNLEAKGHWTIGYGHVLLPKELKTGIIEISPDDKIRWTDGVTEEEAKRVKKKDLIRLSVKKSTIDLDSEVTRALYDSLSDVSFNVGVGGLSEILRESKDSEGKFNIDLFSRELGKWTNVTDLSKRKGIKIRRISQILMARGILLPKNPKHSDKALQTYNVEMSIPEKELIIKYLVHFSGAGTIKKIEESDVTKILEEVSTTSISTPEDFAKILKTNYGT
jgi:GH24 family phage-related lysozyme (muramidase)